MNQEQIFNDIQQKIKADVPEINWIDIDEGQLDVYGENFPIDYPCVLVGFPDCNYRIEAHRRQKYSFTIQVKVVFKMVERLNTAVPQSFRDEAFSHFALLSKVSNAIHLLRHPQANGIYSPLVRQSLRKDSNSDPKIYTITYTGTATETE